MSGMRLEEALDLIRPVFEGRLSKPLAQLVAGHAPSCGPFDDRRVACMGGKPCDAFEGISLDTTAELVRVLAPFADIATDRLGGDVRAILVACALRLAEHHTGPAGAFPSELDARPAQTPAGPSLHRGAPS